MKYCKHTLHETKLNNGIIQTYHYVTEQDVKDFHGEKFFNLWKEMIAKMKAKPAAEGRYYFTDYQTAFWMTNSQIDYV